MRSARDSGEMVGATAVYATPLRLQASIHTTCSGVLAMAKRGQGGWLGRLEDGAELSPIERAVRVTDSVRVCESVDKRHSNFDANAEILEAAGLIGTSVRLDSQAKYVVVARGDADVYLRLPAQKGYVEKIWDHAAGSLLAEEAGQIGRAHV